MSVCIPGYQKLVPGRGLTRKQQNFIRHYLETGNASAAYRVAYDARNMKPATIHRKAHDVRYNGKVAARLEEIEASIRSSTRKEAEKLQITSQRQIHLLEAVYLGSVESGRYSAAIAALRLQSKLAGHFDDHALLPSCSALPASDDLPFLIAEAEKECRALGLEIEQPALLGR